MTDKGAGLLLRVIAKGIDFVLIMAAIETLPKAGWLAGLGYLLISDGLFEGMSAGKKLTGLQVVGPSGAPCTMRESILRNSTLGAGLLLWRLPLIGWLLLAAVVVGEFILLLGSADGARLGDDIAKTKVFEKKEAVQENR